MTDRTYVAPKGGAPLQTQLLTGRAVFTEAYAVIPKGVMMDIVTSYLPFWDKTRLWILSRPLSGFAETFSQYIMEIAPGGGSDRPELDEGAEGAIFVVEGELTVTLDGKVHKMQPGGFAFIPPASSWTVRNGSEAPVRFHWVRKAYEHVDSLPVPEAIFTNEAEITPAPMPGTDGKWATTRFVDSELTPLAHEIVDGFADRGEADLFEVFVGVLPFWSISRKLGLPVGTEDNQRRWALQMLSYPADPVGALAAADAVTEFLMPALEERRREMPFTQRWSDIRRFNNNDDPNDDVVLSRTFYPYTVSNVQATEAPVEYSLTKDSRRFAAPLPRTETISSNGAIEQNTY